MIHYICTIVFNNTSNKDCKDGKGLRFYTEVVAEDKDNARSIAELTAEKMCNKIFQSSLILGCGNITSHECVYGYSRILPISDTPTFTVNVTEKKIVDDWNDCHDKRLRKAINEICANDDYRDALYSIMRAYYERDCNEIVKHYDKDCVLSRANELSFGEFVNTYDFELICREMLSNILNDEDYRAIISFIRPKLSFVDDWREV